MVGQIAARMSVLSIAGTPCGQADLSDRNAAPAACTLILIAFKHSTDRRPASTARIVQRRAAIQNAWRCPVEQNFCADPPVCRGVNGRPHQTQLAAVARGGAMSVTDPSPSDSSFMRQKRREIGHRL